MALSGGLAPVNLKIPSVIDTGVYKPYYTLFIADPMPNLSP